MRQYLFESFICGCVAVLVGLMLYNPQGRMFLGQLTAAFAIVFGVGGTVRGIGWLVGWRG